MASAQDVLDVARAEIGYAALLDPEPGSKYGRWMASVTGEDWLAGPSTSIWWCCCFVSWCLAQAGQGCTGFPSYNTDIVISAAPRFVPLSEARPGDVVIWDWDMDGATDHIGFVDSFDGWRMATIEGNYRNSVARVDRTTSTGCIARIIRPDYDAGEVAPGPGAATTPLEVDGWWGRATTAALQRHFGCVEDGEVWHQWLYTCSAVEHTGGWCYDRSEQGSPVIRALQARIGAEPDGLMGPGSRAALASHFGAASYAEAVAAMQRALNDGKI